MAGIVIHVSSNVIKETHLHHCPYCKKWKREPNDVCRKQGDHTFHCMDHIQHFREAWGMLDSLLDVALTEDQMYRFKEEWQEPPERNPTDFKG